MYSDTAFTSETINVDLSEDESQDAVDGTAVPERCVAGAVKTLSVADHSDVAVTLTSGCPALE